MSGSNGNSGGIGDRSVACEALQFEAQLTSPQPHVVTNLEVGDALTISVVNMKGQRVVQVLTNGEVAGGLAGPDATRLRTCMDQGHRFAGTVRSINRGQVRVFVEHSG